MYAHTALYYMLILNSGFVKLTSVSHHKCCSFTVEFLTAVYGLVNTV